MMKTMMMTDEQWSLLRQTLLHGDAAHQKWLTGMIQGYANAVEGRKVKL